MAASVFDSPLYASLFPAGETARLFSDSAAVRALLLVEGALAKAQGQAGIIPELSAAAIQRASLEIQINPGAIAAPTGQNGVCVPGLVKAFRDEMNAPEHTQYVHFGATSQDVIDTGLMLRLRQSLALAETDIRSLLDVLAEQAAAHADTPMAARTYGQHATPTTWGAVLAQWGHPLADALEALPALRNSSLWVSLSGAAGTSSQLGDDPAALRAALAEGLGLEDPGRSWHTDRGPVLRITGWMAGVTATLGAMGATLSDLASGGVAEVAFAAAGASSTMPQKQNPVAATALVALARQSAALLGGLQGSATHAHQRDAAAWFTEWMLVPQVALSCAAALQTANALVRATNPLPKKMRAVVENGLGLIHAEALTFALARGMSRPDAQAAVKDLCARAVAENTPLRDLAKTSYPDLPPELFEAAHSTGQAPSDARAFAARVRAL